MVFIIDAQSSGISGNMVVGALIDLGVPAENVKQIMEQVSSYFGDVKVNIDKISKGGIYSTYVDVESKDYSTISYNELIDKLDELESNLPSDDLDDKNFEGLTDKNSEELIDKNFNELLYKNILSFSKRVFKRIAVAESKVHGKDLEHVHFHEVGSADAVADVIGAAYCYYYLDMDKSKVIGLPISLGGGIVKSQHGVIPIPSPATIDILKGVQCVGGPVNSELATPTGAAIYMEIVTDFNDFLPSIKPLKVAYGAGKKNFNHPNVLRVIKAESSFDSGRIDVLETNIDHLSGEVVGSLFDSLLDKGALDVSISPITMKKNRPGQLLRVISKINDSERLTKLIFRETGTLGIRTLPYVHRNMITREQVDFKFNLDGEHSVKFKLAYLDLELISKRIEYDDALKISKKIGRPVKDVIEIAERRFNEEYNENA